MRLPEIFHLRGCLFPRRLRGVLPQVQVQVRCNLRRELWMAESSRETRGQWRITILYLHLREWELTMVRCLCLLAVFRIFRCRHHRRIPRPRVRLYRLIDVFLLLPFLFLHLLSIPNLNLNTIPISVKSNIGIEINTVQALGGKY